MPSKSVANPEVKSGQMWRDNDPRMNGRLVKIMFVGSEFVEVYSQNSKVSREISKTRFLRSSAKRGYSLVAEPAPTAPVPVGPTSQNNV